MLFRWRRPVLYTTIGGLCYQVNDKLLCEFSRVSELIIGIATNMVLI